MRKLVHTRARIPSVNFGAYASFLTRRKKKTTVTDE